MQIGWVELVEFRNYRTLSYRPSPRLNLLIGRNAQGKTNLLEAIGVLLTGRSFRTSRLGELPRWGAASAALSGEVARSEGPRVLRRVVRRLDDGRWEASGEGCPWGRVVVFGWQDLAILNGPPAARRNFIDGFAARLYPAHLPALLRYRQVLVRRNRLLQAGGGAAGLAPWDEQLAVTGMELVERRRRAVAALQTELSRVWAGLSGERGKVEVSYRTALGPSSEPGVMLSVLERRREEERRRRQTLVGPHRDDLGLELDGVDARVFGSRGRQRLLALALRIAEVLPVTEAVGSAPVLLLDDALSELDAAARANVLREIQTAEQVFLTSPAALAVSGAASWSVDRGGVTAA